MNYLIHYKNEPKSVQWSARVLIFIFIFEILTPTYLHAGGPSQPEVAGFTPVGMDNMVDPFTGDFTYNIPLMDIEGYPINIAYNAGISMEQEASWVGLGWNLNVGAVNRSLRGLPDDFNGDQIVKKTSMKPNRSYDFDLGVTTELLGKGKKEKPPEPPSTTPAEDTTVDNKLPSLTMKMGIKYNNYAGWASNFSMGLGFSVGKQNSSPLEANLSFSGTSENGSSFSPSVSYSNKLNEKAVNDRTLGGNVGSSFNSRQGLSYITYGAEFSKKYTEAEKKSRKLRSEKETRNPSSSFNIGLNSYTPSASSNLKNFSLTGTFKFGGDAYGLDYTGKIAVAYSSQWIDKKDTVRPAYGYFNLNKGQSDRNAILDFNRDNDGSYTKGTPLLPSTALMNDIFSIQAQGLSGNYKAFRNDIGYVFDPETKTTSDDGSFGFELGAGGIFKGGVDLAYNHTKTVTGAWDDKHNTIINSTKFKESIFLKKNNFSMIESNELAIDKDILFMKNFGDNTPLNFELKGGNINPEVKSPAHLENNSIYSRSEMQTQNMMMQYITVGDVRNGFGINDNINQIYSLAKDHHIGEIIQLGTDGRRYVFGLPAYNYSQEDVTFSVGGKKSNSSGMEVLNDYSGLVNYTEDTDAPTDNNVWGKDNYYQSTITPSYAHAFMLTDVLSDDYIDSDDIKGPSKDDMGAYVKLDYVKVPNYKWRSPMPKNEAYRNEGLMTDKQDDKASFIYGEKELWYVKKIETKNYVAIFFLSKRDDGHSVNDRNGGIENSMASSLRVDSISLFSIPEFNIFNTNATPIQTVHFTYDYSLCEGYPLNSNLEGKLTLTKIHFTYQGSKRMAKSAYEFKYKNNQKYNIKAVDRWGNFKPNPGLLKIKPLINNLSNADYPYVDQNKVLADDYASAWCMNRIKLPSGGVIEVEYESDDYAYVQDRSAMRMFKIIAHEDLLGIASYRSNNFIVMPVSTDTDRNRMVCFEMIPGYDDINEYVKGIKDIYFRALTRFREKNDSVTSYDFVSGYGLKDTADVVEFDGKKYGRIKFFGEALKDKGLEEYSPIARTAILFGRINLSNFIYNSATIDPSDNANENSIMALGKSLVNSLDSYGDMFKNPNKVVYEQNRGTNIVTNKSWIRLNDPSKSKLGGGHRVKSIKMYDNWNEMSGTGSFSYGQQYSYRSEDGKSSSGVASYEPQLGGDENPFKIPERYNEKIRMAPDRNLFMDAPIMESHFPSPSVGYSRVEIRNLERAGVIRTATGTVVKEFFTAKDFPTITSVSKLEAQPFNNFIPYTPKIQKVTVEQGFSIEINDMHGKPKKELIYPENGSAPISSVEYIYQTKNGRLDNEINVIQRDGTVKTEESGVRREIVADYRKSSTKFTGVAGQTNLNLMMISILPFPVPTIWPHIDRSSTEFRSATLSTIVNRFGILASTIAKQDGSTVQSNNIAYESNTGQLLITQTTTNFNDSIYSLTFPAYWKYDQLGQAYKNWGSILAGNISNGLFALSQANEIFIEGDELKIVNYENSVSNYTKGWVNKVSGNGIEIINKEGNLISMNNVIIEIIRSGRRNKQMESMASITQLTNPLHNIKNNSYSKVLNAGAIEFSQYWKTYCECFGGSGTFATTNPFILGTKGNFRPVKSYTHLTDRTQTNLNGNTNIRKDGVFKSYTPFYKLQNGAWNVDAKNWTYVSEVTEFSPNGMTLETKDALGRYAASQYGFNNTMTTAVASNTSTKQLLNLHFEDADYNNCSDENVKINGLIINRSNSHTGRNSIKVSASNPVIISSVDISCPTSECSIDLVLKGDAYLIKDALAPITIQVQDISGSVDIVLNPDNTLTILNLEPSSYYEFILTLQDANGCQLVQTIKKQ